MSRNDRPISKIAIVSMPFASSRRPSLQLGLLKGLAEIEGWKAETFHLSLDFAALIGRPIYETLCQHRGIQLGDWIFSLAAFGEDSPDKNGVLVKSIEQEYMVLLNKEGIEDIFEWLMRMRTKVVPAFIESARITLESGEFDVIAFTSTFQQNVASFALANFLKQGDTKSILLFGGANFDDTMGIEFVRSIHSIDYAAIGEGDEIFPQFLNSLSGGHDPSTVAGIASRNKDGTIKYFSKSSPFENLNELPIPNYDEYFDRMERLGFLDDDPLRQIDLPFESSRGCWWGQKSHCIFCGLNSGSMKFRSKSPERILKEITTLSQRYHSFYFEAVDNIIDMDFFGSMLPKIRDLNASWNIFYEIKSNLRPDQVATLSAAGVKRIQPGIESLSTHVLKLMRKGVTASQNINLLRWCAYYGISVSWNLLWGFPGENESHYHEQTELFPLLSHLQPPNGQGRLWMERFSPLFTQSEHMGVTEIRPSESYYQVYPNYIDLDKAAYFFDYKLENSLPDSFFSPIVDQLDTWRSRWHSSAPPSLRCFRSPEFIRIEDHRGLNEDGKYELEGPLADIYMAFFNCPTGISRQAAFLKISARVIDDAINDFVSRGLMIRDNDRALSLALPAVAPG